MDRNSDHVVRDLSLRIRDALQTGEAPDALADRLLNRDGGRSLDLPAIAEQRQHFHPSEVWLLDFIVGMFLQKHGRPLEAREFLQRAVDHPFSSDSAAPVARDTIRKLDQDANKPKADAKG